MKLSYKRRFSQFIDTYIFTYYSAGIRVAWRLLGGPLLIFLGIVLLGFTRRLPKGFWFIFLWGLGFALALYGLFYFLRPAIHILLVWLRRQQFLGPEGAPVTLKLDPQASSLLIQAPESETTLSLDDILYIQHRADSTWIITNRDQVILVPRHDLIEGHHDTFIQAIEHILDEKEQKH